MSDLVVGLADAKPAPGPTDGNQAAATPSNDGRARCSWAASTVDYAHYHDTEWGRPVDDERTLYEKLCLEGFQSGLSWLTILRKREAFRDAFANFDATRVAGFGSSDVDRLLDNSGIIRHRGKIEASISNAQTLVRLWDEGGSLASLIWSFQPERSAPPRSFDDVAASTPESAALAKELKRLGFRFVGPTTTYAAMQAMGVVNDHLEGCWVREVCDVPTTRED